MIKIRILNSPYFLLSKDRVQQVQQLFRLSFPKLANYAEQIPAMLYNPFKYGYQSTLLIAEGALNRVDAFALLMHFSETSSSFLDFFATRRDIRGGGIGSALYDAVRELCQEMGEKGIYLEVQPDVEDLTPDPQQLENAKKRIRFYEQYGVHVVENDAYSQPVGDPPTSAYLLFDGLGRSSPLGMDEAKKSVELILTRRFGQSVDNNYIRQVAEGFADDLVKLRPLRYSRKKEKKIHSGSFSRLSKSFVVVSSPRHEMHHVKERGYFERPIRVHAIKQVLDEMNLFNSVQPRKFNDKHLSAVHDADFIYYIRTISTKLKAKRAVYPDTFPLRRLVNRPKVLATQAGYYCIDTGTPLYPNAYIAARAAVDTVLTATDELLSGKRLVYAVCRPPGHHAGKSFFGGFCYFNNAAIAAQYLSLETRVAILDIDFHHGNGTQDIFFERSDVLTVSIHGHPDYSYPYFSGYSSETGLDHGEGYNHNFALPPVTDEKQYLSTLTKALHLIKGFKPDALIVSLGFDILKGDPTGTFLLRPAFMQNIGAQLIKMNMPMLIVQEGGYNLKNIKSGCKYLFKGLQNM
ncbi:histone deacetylase family protein [bacterium]|nr:histone deacetylase family protein [bacterium]